MTPEDRQRIYDLFLAALARDSAERSRFLDEACAGEAMLRAEVDRLLVHDEQAQRAGFLGPLSAPTLPGPPPGQPVVDRVGDYEVLGELGRGGMGVVYKARQLSLNRLVALKMIRDGRLAEEVEQRRFEAEAEAVAHLDHPNIVAIYEIGRHGGGPFFSMRLVEGGCLARQRGRFVADPRSAAALMAVVARAVHHAHQRGVLHRDLKPGNILLDAQGQPHVTDFGLAKRVEVEGSLTQSGAIIGTPEYMAPEQAAAQKGLTTAADVYGLGAVLYSLLTGRPPFQGGNVWETLRQVIESEPPPPRRLNGLVDRDLDTICLKCLAREPAARYGSAEALADDLERWLRGEPVLARRVGPVGRLSRWSRRNPAVAGLMAVLLVVLLSGLIGVTYLWRLAEARGEEARQKQAEAERQQTLADDHYALAWKFIDDYFASKSPSGAPRQGGQAPSRQELLEGAVVRFRELAGRKDDPDVRDRLAWAYTRLGGHYWDAARKDEARAAFQEALVIREKLAEEQGGSSGVALAGILEVLGAKEDDVNESRRLHLRALELRERYAAEEPGDPRRQGQLGFSYQNLGFREAQAGRYEQALAWYEKARDRWQQCVAAYPGEVRYQTELALTMKDTGLAHLLVGYGRAEKGQDQDAARAYRDAAAWWERSRELRLEVARGSPDNVKNLQQLASLLGSLAVVQAELNQPEAAVASRQNGCTVRELVVEKLTSGDVRKEKEQLAEAYEALAEEQETARQSEEAAHSRHKAHTLCEELSRPTPPLP